MAVEQQQSYKAVLQSRLLVFKNTMMPSPTNTIMKKPTIVVESCQEMSYGGKKKKKNIRVGIKLIRG